MQIINEKRHPVGAWLIFLALIFGIVAAVLLHAKAGLIILLAVIAFLIYGTRIHAFYRERREGPLEYFQRGLPEDEKIREEISGDMNSPSNPNSYTNNPL